MIVSFSGIDGSGKTTRARHVAELLTACGVKSRYTAPEYRGYGAFKDRVATDLGDQYAFYDRPGLAREAVDCLVADWRAWWSRNRGPQADTVLCCDRYLPDVHAQAEQLGVPTDRLRRDLADLPGADVSFLLVVDPATARRRIEERAGPPPNLSESLPWLQTLAAAFDRLDAGGEWGFVRLASTADAAEAVELVLGEVRGAR